MTVQRLAMHRVEKPWGRRALWPGFPDPGADEGPIGEIWFQPDGEDEPELLIKYLFTSEKLSIQVHPDDEQARRHGHKCGKDEAWLVLAADPGATVGLGTVRPLDGDALRAAALDGSIEQLLDWKPVKAGDFIYSPARTVHAIGPGLTLVEIQQNADLTYRLFDYGRPRETQLELGIEVADARPFEIAAVPEPDDTQRQILALGPKFVVERRRGGVWQVDPGMTNAWFVPIAGEGTIADVTWRAGDCFAINGSVQVTSNGEADILLAYPGSRAL